MIRCPPSVPAATGPFVRTTSQFSVHHDVQFLVGDVQSLNRLERCERVGHFSDQRIRPGEHPLGRDGAAPFFEIADGVRVRTRTSCS